MVRRRWCFCVWRQTLTEPPLTCSFLSSRSYVVFPLRFFLSWLPQVLIACTQTSGFWVFRTLQKKRKQLWLVPCEWCKIFEDVDGSCVHECKGISFKDSFRARRKIYSNTLNVQNLLQQLEKEKWKSSSYYAENRWISAGETSRKFGEIFYTYNKNSNSRTRFRIRFHTDSGGTAATRLVKKWVTREFCTTDSLIYHQTRYGKTG